MIGKHNPKHRIGPQVFCYANDDVSSFPVTLISYDNDRYMKARRVDTGEIIEEKRGYFFRKSVNDPSVTYGIGPKERFVLGGGDARNFKKRMRKTQWLLGADGNFDSKRSAVRAALSTARKTGEEVELMSEVDTRLRSSTGGTLIVAHPDGYVVQYWGAVRQARAEHPKFLFGYGRRKSGLPRSRKMRQRRNHVH